MQRFHGIDKHKLFSTISALNRDGVEVKFVPRCTDLAAYISTLTPDDVVVMETGAGTFYWSDRIELQGAQCFILDPRKFRIIKDSWNKTDKNDCRNMAKALWVMWGDSKTLRKMSAYLGLVPRIKESGD